MSVRLFTTLRELSGKSVETLEFPGQRTVSVVAALKALAQKYGRPFWDYLFDGEGNVKGSLQFLVNGKSIATLRGVDTELREGDVLAIIPPAGGG